MDLQQLSKQIDELEVEPPFHLWDPEFCGDMDLIIKSDGTWWYMGSPIGRIKLVKLFARVLILEHDEYFLKTPAEKIRIRVEDAPFVIIGWQQAQTEEGKAIEVTSNLGHKALLSEAHPLTCNLDEPGQPRLYVTLHRGLKALIHRNVYYQWVELGREKRIGDRIHLMLKSGMDEFSLGVL